MGTRNSLPVFIRNAQMERVSGLLMLKGSDKGAALVEYLPLGSQLVAKILIGHGYCRHGVRELGERGIIDIFVPAKMIVIPKQSRFNLCQAAGLEVNDSMPLFDAFPFLPFTRYPPAGRRRTGLHPNLFRKTLPELSGEGKDEGVRSGKFYFCIPG
jgi:hypothetical protein